MGRRVRSFGGKADAVRVSGRGATPPRFMITDAASTPTYTMPYSDKVIADVTRAPKTLGNQLGRWAVHLDFPVTKVAEITSATRQTVYNWFNGGEIMWAYRPTVETLLKILQTSSTADEAWRKACKAFNIET